MNKQPINKQMIYAELQKNKAILQKYGVKKIGLFGSFVRDEACGESDIDFLVEIEKDKKTFKNFMDFAFFLEDLFNRKVELVTIEGLSPYLGPYILNTVEYVPLAGEFLYHIRDECRYLLEQYEKWSFEDFATNKTLSHAACRSLEIIGEASKNVHSNFKLKYAGVDWKRMSGIRDVIIHNYFGIDFEIVWDTIKSDIPVLHNHIKEIIKKESNL